MYAILGPVIVAKSKINIIKGRSPIGISMTSPRSGNGMAVIIPPTFSLAFLYLDPTKKSEIPNCMFPNRNQGWDQVEDGPSLT